MQLTIQLTVVLEVETYEEAAAKLTELNDTEGLAYITSIKEQFPFINEIVSVTKDGAAVEMDTSDAMNPSEDYVLVNSGDSGILVLSLQQF